MSDQTHLHDPRWDPEQQSLHDFASDNPQDTEEDNDE